MKKAKQTFFLNSPLDCVCKFDKFTKRKVQQTEVCLTLTMPFEPCIWVFIQVWWLVLQMHLQLFMLTH